MTLYKIMQLQQTFSSRLSLKNTHGSSVVPFAMPTPLELPVIQACEMWEIKNFKAYSRVISIAEAQLPDFELEDSETQRLYKALDVEWKSPRKQLNLYVGDTNNWLLLGSVSLLNPSGYPYRTYNLLNIYSSTPEGFIGTNTKVAVSIVDVGYGLLAPQDKVDIQLDILRTISCIPS